MAIDSHASLAALDLIESRTRQHLAEIDRALGRLAANLTGNQAGRTTTAGPAEVPTARRAAENNGSPRTAPAGDDARQQERDRVQQAMEEHLRQIRAALDNPPLREATFA